MESQSCAEPVRVCTAHRQQGATPQREVEIAIASRRQRLHPVEPDDGRAMNAHELRRVELAFELAQTHAHQVHAATHVQANIVSCGIDVVDLPHRDQIDAATILDGDAGLLLAGSDALACASDCTSKALATERLQQIVYCFDVEGGDGILVMGGDLDRGRPPRRVHPGQDLQAIEIRQAHVE